MFNTDRRIDHCKKLFDSIVSNPDRKLHPFLPSKSYRHYNLRRQHHFASVFPEILDFFSKHLKFISKYHEKSSKYQQLSSFPLSKSPKNDSV